MTSQELARRLGEDIIARLGLTVDLSEPGVNLSVDVISEEALVYAERVRGPGGLPVGSSGRVLHLLSGGIDSPVAAWLMMKRGCAPAFLHFYLAPGPAPIVASKISDLVRELSQRGEEQRLILIPFSPYQVATTDLRQEFEPVVFRRFMRMVAERVAAALSMPAISTGDSLAQVASQTLQNIACIDSGSSLPTLRPLLGYDKDEIVRLAKEVGTYETSLLEYKDCCSIVSKHPRTRMKIADVDEAARFLAFDDLADRCISMGTVVYFREDGAVDQRPLAEVLEARSPGEKGVVQRQPPPSPPGRR
jgi:thiamine biosynthesis protein ThiI